MSSAARAKGEDGRGITVTGYSEPALRTIPIVVEMFAGHPIEASQGESGFLTVGNIGHLKRCLALIVRGVSMIGAGILDGDIAIIERPTLIRSGTIIAALVNGDSTLKRYVEENGRTYLVLENEGLVRIDVTGSMFEQGLSTYVWLENAQSMLDSA